MCASRGARGCSCKASYEGQQGSRSRCIRAIASVPVDGATVRACTRSTPRSPYVAIIGGAKISGKIEVIRNLLSLADRVLICRATTYTFLKAARAIVGDSLVEEDRIELASELLKIGEGRIAFPEEHVIADSFSADASVRTGKSDVPDGWLGLDIGPRTVEAYSRTLGDADDRLEGSNGSL